MKHQGAGRLPVPSWPNVTSAFGSFSPCIGGSVDDHLGGTINLTGPVPQDTPFSIEVQYYIPGGSCSSTQSATIYGTVLSGQSIGTVDNCSAGILIPTGGTVCSATGYLDIPPGS